MSVLQQGLQRQAAVLAFGLSMVACSIQTAWAGGTANDNQSAAGIATVGAGQAAEAGDASVIFFNPAALTRFKRVEVLNSAAVALFYNDYTSTRNQDGAVTNQGTQGSAGQKFERRDGYDAAELIPALFIVAPINEKLVMGFSASGSHGLMARYDENFPGRGQGRDVDLKVTRLNLGFGYKLSPTLSLGANGSYERYFQSIKIRLNFRDAVSKLGPPGTTTALDTTAALGATPPIPDETDAKLRMFGWAFNAQGGVLWEPTEITRVGLSYRPKTKFRSNTGTLQINETSQTAAFRDFLQGGLIGATGPALGINGPQAAGDLAPYQRAKQDITFPDELRLSVFHHATPKLDLMFTYGRQDYRDTKLRYTRESNGRVIEDVPQDFKVAQTYRVGLNYKMYRRLTLHAGYATENGVVGDALRIPILPDNDRKFYGLGASVDVNRDIRLTFAYQLLDIKAGAVGNNNQITPVEVSGAPYNGIANLDVRFFSVGYTERF
ncbi:MAG TPA: outer membrane protein transport protein [Limnobacter sp.]|uniref:OmpP1/FadL family transporter n=1 Tax=Limnobacter sp. TaxID=2003368 RepID=UPI002EDAB683